MTFEGTCLDELEDFVTSWIMLDVARLDANAVADLEKE